MLEFILRDRPLFVRGMDNFREETLNENVFAEKVKQNV